MESSNACGWVAKTNARRKTVSIVDVQQPPDHHTCNTMMHFRPDRNERGLNAVTKFEYRHLGTITGFSAGATNSRLSRMTQEGDAIAAENMARPLPSYPIILDVIDAPTPQVRLNTIFCSHRIDAWSSNCPAQNPCDL